jgi:hypothetical protein
MKMVTAHGTAAYRRGCRCPTCREAESTRKRQQRERKLTGATVVNLPAPPRSGVLGEVEAAVLVEVEPLPAAGQRPSDVANARAMARILDDEARVHQWPAAAQRLTSILTELHNDKKQQKRRRLASVAQMAERNRP